MIILSSDIQLGLITESGHLFSFQIFKKILLNLGTLQTINYISIKFVSNKCVDKMFKTHCDFILNIKTYTNEFQETWKMTKIFIDQV